MDIHKYFVEIIIHNYSCAHIYETKISAVECSIGSMKGQHQMIAKMQIQYADCARLQIKIIRNTIFIDINIYKFNISVTFGHEV